MNNNTRKIVVLNNLKSPRIEQAIFILHDEVEISENDALKEAQKIVDCYVKSLLSPPPQKVQKKPGWRFFAGMALYTFFTAILTAHFLSLL